MANAWAIILSGGEGQRLRFLTEQWLGCHQPKQYCTFIGTRSLLQHTWDRTTQIVPRERIITVIGVGHRRFLESHQATGRLIEQPCARGTAAGIYLAASYVRTVDPGATVFIFPSDHFVFPEDQFMAQVARAGRLAECCSDSLILVGAPPADPDPEYGWIRTGISRQIPGSAAGSGVIRFREVVCFREKPSRQEAEELFRRGCLLNTLVMAVKIETLWRLGQSLLPETMARFAELQTVLRAARAGRVAKEHEQIVLQHIYDSLEPADFSREILQPAAPESLLLPITGVLWSDWGREERIVRSLASLRRRPYFLDAQERAAPVRESLTA